MDTHFCMANDHSGVTFHKICWLGLAKTISPSPHHCWQTSILVRDYLASGWITRHGTPHRKSSSKFKSDPLILMWPAVGLSSPASKCNSVLLPHPEAPTIAIENNRTTQALNKFGQNLPKPRLIIIISAHWQSQHLEFPYMSIQTPAKDACRLLQVGELHRDHHRLS